MFVPVNIFHNKTIKVNLSWPDLLEVSGWSVSLGESSSLLLDPTGQGETDLGVMHLRNQGAAALASLNNLAPRDVRVRNFNNLSGEVVLPNNLDGVGPGPVPGSHVPVALGDGSGDGEVPVLTVHVVGAGPGVVSQPDAKVLDLKWLPFPDLLHGHDLTGGLLELPELPQEVPEAGLGNDLVGGKDPHPRNILLEQT